MDHAENASCAHRVRPGQTLCSLCLQHVNEARQLLPARERFVAYRELVQRRMSLQRRNIVQGTDPKPAPSVLSSSGR